MKLPCLKSFNSISHYLRRKFKFFIFIPWPKRPHMIQFLPTYLNFSHASLFLAHYTSATPVSFLILENTNLFPTSQPLYFLFLYLECSSCHYSHIKLVLILQMSPCKEALTDPLIKVAIPIYPLI